jgi:hypothetical protein
MSGLDIGASKIIIALFEVFFYLRAGDTFARVIKGLIHRGLISFQKLVLGVLLLRELAKLQLVIAEHNAL